MDTIVYDDEIEGPHTNIDTMRKLLHDMPYLNVLILSSTPTQWSPEVKLFPKKVLLPNLKVLSLGYDVHLGVLKDVLSAAIYLRRTCNFKIEYITPFVSTGQVSTIKHMEFEPSLEYKKFYSEYTESVQISHLKSISSQSYCLKSGIWLNVALTFQKILTKNKETLETIVCFNPAAFLSQFQLPVFEKVRPIGFMYEPLNFDDPFNIQHYRPLLNGQRLIQIFLNVMKIKFDMRCFREKLGEWNDIVHPSDPLPNVKDLTLNVVTGKEDCLNLMEKMGMTFPNVEKLKIDIKDLTDFLTVGPVIWSRFPRVQRIKISIDNFDYNSSFRDDMDSMITRLPVDVCVQLREDSQRMSIQDVERMRENPAIHQLKELRSLEMKLSQLDYWKVTASTPIFSNVSGMFGFGLMRHKLKVTLELEAKGKKLRSLWVPVKSYVEIDP